MAYDEIDVPPRSRLALEVLTLLSKKWHPVVLLALDHHDRQGFNDLLDAIPDVSGKVLSGTLDALQDAGLVERAVVSESPLRVEYALTDVGRDMGPIFESLSAWGERHLDVATATVVLADGDRRITEMYQGWLHDRYSIRRAHNYDEFVGQLDDAVDVVVLDDELPATDPTRVLTETDGECRTILLVGDRPDVELLETPCDDVLRKPVVRETMLEAIDAQLGRLDEPAAERERAALEAKLSMLESVHSQAVLEGNDDYVTHRSRLEALDE